MRTHTLIAAALGVCALVLTACGGDSPGSGDTAADRQKQMRDAELAYARCMREHGVDMPDPQPGQRGIRITAPKDASPQKMREADEACRKHLEAVKPPELSDAQKKEIQEAALAHARCMRDHGIDMPDPTFGENGQATVRIGRGSGIDPDSSRFKRAEEECRSKLPRIPGGEGPSTSEGSE